MKYCKQEKLVVHGAYWQGIFKTIFNFSEAIVLKVNSHFAYIKLCHINELFAYFVFCVGCFIIFFIF